MSVDPRFEHGTAELSEHAFNEGMAKLMGGPSAVAEPPQPRAVVQLYSGVHYAVMESRERVLEMISDAVDGWVHLTWPRPADGSLLTNSLRSETIFAVCELGK